MATNIITRIIPTIALCLCIFGCNKNSHDTRLLLIAENINDDPAQAVARLDSLNRNTLAKRDQHYYDLLTVKARDKAYITHTSDSLILSVLDYYKDTDTENYPEALYYAGRVYSDLGDFPNALTYFQNALDVVPDHDIHLIGCITSQTGRLLISLRQYNQAIPYIEKSLHVDSLENNTYNLAYDNILLANTYLNIDSFKQASKYVDLATHYAGLISEEEKYAMILNQVAIEFRSGNLQTALKQIKEVLPKAQIGWGDAGNFYATQIYYKAGIYDTAFLYANKLRTAPVLKDRRVGYYFLFKPELKKFLPKDSIDSYLNKYEETIELYLDAHDTESTITQSTLYNYTIHERERIASDQKRASTERFLFFALLSIMVLFIVILFIKNNERKKALVIKDTLITIANLQKIIAEQHESISELKKRNKTPEKDTDTPNKTSLINELITRTKDASGTLQIPKEISDSSIYIELKNLISNNDPIQENTIIWEEIENLIARISPNFFDIINSLSSKPITLQEKRVLCLIKLGLTPKEIGILITRTKGTVSSHRSYLSIKLLGQKVGNKEFDNIIRSI